jgi:hypothetical protein
MNFGFRCFRGIYCLHCHDIHEGGGSILLCNLVFNCENKIQCHNLEERRIKVLNYFSFDGNKCNCTFIHLLDTEFIVARILLSISVLQKHSASINFVSSYKCFLDIIRSMNVVRYTEEYWAIDTRATRSLLVALCIWWDFEAEVQLLE